MAPRERALAERAEQMLINELLVLYHTLVVVFMDELRLSTELLHHLVERRVRNCCRFLGLIDSR